jgi:exopolysaccharide biosynthesis WecB/TagA/CpsF family protein
LATVNLDHLVKMRDSPAFTRAYAAQDIVVADGWPIVTLSRLAGRPVELVPGSDMMLPLCQWAADAGVRVALVGSTEDTLSAARSALTKHFPSLDIHITLAPPMGFDPASPAAAEILQRLQDEGISLCLLALGAPKQEEFAARGRTLVPSVGFASIGAGLDFLSGRQKRAPRVLRYLRLEWLWRALMSPARLLPRYANCLFILPSQAIRALHIRVSHLYSRIPRLRPKSRTR